MEITEATGYKEISEDLWTLRARAYKDVGDFKKWKLLSIRNLDWQELKEAGDAKRIEFQRSGLSPPEYLRVIDCQASLEQSIVVLTEWDLKGPESAGGGYTAISHTDGQEVYGVFNCSCATKCFTKVPRATPAKTPCKGHPNGRDRELQQKKVTDVLNMCKLLIKAGAHYAWHDGVCIAQHDDEEVRHVVQHMGWIYANATETVIFLHSIDRPMAPIKPGIPDRDVIMSPWQTRVWTFQEAALSNRRRYCVRKGESLLGCRSWEEFEIKLAVWYEDDSSIAIVEEIEFLNLVWEIDDALSEASNFDKGPISESRKFQLWANCLLSWQYDLQNSYVSFPTFENALVNCSARGSTHEGDRINSILALAGVQDFYVPKDKLEEFTIEFFRKLGKNGLALAAFTTNRFCPASETIKHTLPPGLLQRLSSSVSELCRTMYGRAFTSNRFGPVSSYTVKASHHRRYHTWAPSLSGHLMMSPCHFQKGGPNFHTDNIEFEVLKNGELELKGSLARVDVRFNMVDFGEEEAGCEVPILEEEEDKKKDEEEGLHLHIRTLPLMNNFVASLAGASPACELGEVMLPIFLMDENAYQAQAPPLEHFFNALAFEPLQRWPVDMLMYLNLVKGVNPLDCLHFSSSLPSFPTSLIFPAEVLKLNAPSCNFIGILVGPFPYIMDSDGVLVPYTDSHRGLTKIGCFAGNEVLRDILLREYFHKITFPTRVVIH